MDKLKVIKIVSPYKIVINGGSNMGIINGDKFLIYGLSTEIIKDPDTGEEYEKLEYFRGKGKVIHTQNTIATVESIEKTVGKRKVKSLPGLTTMFSPNEEIQYTDDILPFDQVQIGDYARATN